MSTPTPLARVTSLVVAAGIAATLVSCSGTRGSESAPRPQPTGPVEATTTTEPTFSGAGGEKFCELARAANERLSGLVQAAPSPDSARTLFTSAAAAVRGLAAAAPAEIVTDARTVAGAYDSLLRRLAKADWKPERLPEEIDEQLNSPSVRLAGERLQVYGRTVCGVAG